MQEQLGRKKGTVSVISSNERLQLQFRYGGKKRYISLGLEDSPHNRRFAEGRAQKLQVDIQAENVDETPANNWMNWLGN